MSGIASQVEHRDPVVIKVIGVSDETPSSLISSTHQQSPAKPRRNGVVNQLTKTTPSMSQIAPAAQSWPAVYSILKRCWYIHSSVPS